MSREFVRIDCAAITVFWCGNWGEIDDYFQSRALDLAIVGIFSLGALV